MVNDASILLQQVIAHFTSCPDSTYKSRHKFVDMLGEIEHLCSSIYEHKSAWGIRHEGEPLFTFTRVFDHLPIYRHSKRLAIQVSFDDRATFRILYEGCLMAYVRMTDDGKFYGVFKEMVEYNHEISKIITSITELFNKYKVKLEVS